MLEYEKKYWKSGSQYIAGIDEAGRGPLAGPVVAAAVILPQNIDLPEVNDSKKISEKKRERLYTEIYQASIALGIGIVHEEEIDKKNILQGTYNAMRQSIGALSVQPDILLVDGNKADIKHYSQESIIDGDQKSLSIAAASIIAKVTRDRLMRQYDIIFPDYGFAKHKGYGTKHHIEIIKSQKASPIHRKSFNPISNHLPSFAYIKRNRLVNKLGEQLVACKMIRCGYHIVEVNYIVPSLGEIDIISRYNDKLIFMTVNTHFDDSISNISQPQKREDNNRILDVAMHYLDNNELNDNYCFKNGEVTLGKGSPKIKILEEPQSILVE